MRTKPNSNFNLISTSMSAGQRRVPSTTRSTTSGKQRHSAGFEFDEAKLRKRLLDGAGIEIAGAFGPLAGKGFRIRVMGPLATEDNVQFFLKKLAKTLSAEGCLI